MSKITAIILTHNEEKHLKRCIESCENLATEIIIIDSGSTDNTQAIASNAGATFIHHPWPGNQAAQFNWALDNISISSDWILRLDADEYLLPETGKEIKKTIESISDTVNGIYLKRRVYFKGKWIRFGGYYPIKLLRLWRKGYGRYEDVEMDEHIILSSGSTQTLQNDFVDENLNDITWWINKHNNYSSREVAFFLKSKNNHEMIEGKIFHSQEKRKRWYKQNFYYLLPPYLRAFVYFIFRYVFLLGFLDGKKGLIWHFLQGFWYRFLVDVKISENESRR